jgi:hypothetical protein
MSHQSPAPPAARAIKSLANLPDDRLFREIAEGLGLVHEHAAELARCLREASRPRSIRVLEPLLREEAAKYLILLDAVRCPRSGLADQLSKFSNHVARLIYADVCDWHVASFGELAGYIGHDLQQYYLDGPNDVDWIFRNSINSEREEALYVDYLRNDDGTFRWHSPLGCDDAFRLGIPEPSVVRLVAAMHEAGLGSAPALAVIAKHWRDVVVGDDTTVGELHELNLGTLKALESAGLLIECDPAVYRAIIHGWSFPLHTQSLKEIEVDVGELRRRRDAWSPG